VPEHEGRALNDERRLRQALKRYAVKAPGEEWGVLVTSHRFRHTHAAELLNEGFTLPDVQRRLGRSRSGGMGSSPRTASRTPTPQGAGPGTLGSEPARCRGSA